MFETDRRQILVYVVVAIAVVAVGFVSLKRWDRGDEGRTATERGAARTTRLSGPGDAGAFTLGRGARRLVVDVSGAVARPGVYEFPDGARVIDAIRRAGGPAREAATEAINRAAVLADGQQVVVPARTPSRDSVSLGGSTGIPGPAEGPVSLGTATAAQLEEIDGIGPVTARKIIEFRDSKGGLGSVEDLDRVSGIGPVTMESLRSALQP